MKSKDLILRATGAKIPLRFIVADITDTANKIGKMHGAKAWALTQMAETTLASLFLSASLKYPGTVNVAAEFSGDLSIVQADTTPMGLCRAMIPQDEIQKVGDFELLLSPQRLRVKKFNEHAKLLSEGIVEMGSTKIAPNLAIYLFQSEQLKTAVGIESQINADDPTKLDFAAGFYLEAFPDAEESHLIIMEEVIKSLGPISQFYKDDEFQLTQLLDQIAGPVDYVIHKEITPTPYCSCSRDRTLDSLSALNNSDLQEMIDDGENLEIYCNFCRTRYEITIDELKTIVNNKENS